MYIAALEELKQSEKPPSEAAEEETFREFGSKRPSVHDKCLHAYTHKDDIKPEKPKSMIQENKEKPESNFAIIGAYPKMPF